MPFTVPVDTGSSNGSALGAALPDTFLPLDFGQQVAPEVSWLHYSCMVVLDEDDNLAVSTPLAGKVNTGLGGGLDALGTVANLRGNTGIPGSTVGSTVPNIIQRVSGPTFSARLVGRAVRICYPIAPPVLLTLGGQPVVQAGRRIVNGSSGSLGGFPIYYLNWNIRYILASAPNVLATPASISDNLNGTGA